MIKKAIFLASLVTLSSASAYAADAACTVDVKGTDAMAYDKKVIEIPKSCLDKEITFNLEHTGKLPKAAMGHNLIVSETVNEKAITDKAPVAGPTKDYIDPSVSSLIIGHTKVLGGGEKDSFTLAKKKLDAKKDYSFFCSFPGHFAIMTGKIVFVDAAKK